MKKTTQTLLLIFIAFLNLSAQTKKEIYKFSNDIKTQIEKDTVPWKYQMGAWDYSFSGYYQKALECWDISFGGVPKISLNDSLYFNTFKPYNAKEYILNRSGKEQVIIINEAHHNARHRVFTTSLLQRLYKKGYRFLGLETLDIKDSLLNKRKFPVLNSGYYSKEPQFGNLIDEALKIGFTVFAYEARNDKNGKDREIEQAQNIAKVIAKNPKSKFLIHCGFEHIIEGTPYNKDWEKAMAGRLKEITGINPFTIDQISYTEKSEKKFNSPYIGMVNAKETVIMVDKNGNTFNGGIKNDQTDCRIIHPITKYLNNRPNWQLMDGKRKTYKIPAAKIPAYPVLILAYRVNEFDHDGIPSDVLEIINKNQTGYLVLEKGKYDIIIKDKDYKIVNRYPQTIN